VTGFNHGITGAVIALTIKNPVLAVPLSFVSHFAQDLLPHHDYFAGPNDQHLFSRKFNAMLVVDFLLSVSLVVALAILFPAHRWLIIICMIAAACPDLTQSYYHLYLSRIKKRKPKIDRLSKFHYSLQWAESSWGGLVEIAWATTGLFIILSLR
jgi:hypothetical protein